MSNNQGMNMIEIQRQESLNKPMDCKVKIEDIHLLTKAEKLMDKLESKKDINDFKMPPRPGDPDYKPRRNRYFNNKKKIKK